MKKKIISVILIAVALLTVLAGCGNKVPITHRIDKENETSLEKQDEIREKLGSSYTNYSGNIYDVVKTVDGSIIAFTGDGRAYVAREDAIVIDNRCYIWWKDATHYVIILTQEVYDKVK